MTDASWVSLAPALTPTGASTGASPSTASTSAPDARGQGAGAKLLNGLAEACERKGLYKLTSRLFTTNTASRALHLACGFEEVGIQRRHGRLYGQWKDCVVVDRRLSRTSTRRA